jgi:hypothetical protein
VTAAVAALQMVLHKTLAHEAADSHHLLCGCPTARIAECAATLL